MTAYVLTPTTLAPNTRSVDLVGAGQTVTTSDTCSISAKGNTRTLIVVLEELGAGAATVTFAAGDNPPSFLAEALTINLATSDLRILRFEPGQFINDDQLGSINLTVGLQSVKVYTLRESNAE